MANINDGNTDTDHSSLFRGQRLFVFSLGCPVTFYCIKTFTFSLKLTCIKAQKISFLIVLYFTHNQSIFLLNNSR